MARQPIIILGESFATKKALTAKVQAILHATPEGQLLGSYDAAFMHVLLERHSEAGQKIGVGVRSFSTRNPGYGPASKCFCLTRIDGTTTDFSYLKCITPEDNPLKDFQAACRTAVVPQIQSLKAHAFSSAAVYSCPVLGTPITIETCHVDHIPPRTFASIVDAFITEHGLRDVEPGKDNDTECRFADPADADLFAAFHAARAHLRIVSKRANLSDIKRGAR